MLCDFYHNKKTETVRLKKRKNEEIKHDQSTCGLQETNLRYNDPDSYK